MLIIVRTPCHNHTDTSTLIIEDVPKHVGPNLVFADDDQQRSRPGRLAKAFGLRPPAFASRLFDPSDCSGDRRTDKRTNRQRTSGYFVTDFVTDGRTDGRTN